jgi:CcmD family protein
MDGRHTVAGYIKRQLRPEQEFATHRLTISNRSYQPMNRGLQFAFAAYGLAFLVFFVYMWLMIARQNKLDRKLDELKSHLTDRM